MRRKKQNVVFIIILMVVSLVMLFFLIMEKKRQEGDKVLIYVNGTLMQEVSLDTEDEILIHGNPGDNVLVIQNGKAYMKEASCDNHVCIQQGEISKNGETIICLPNQILVEVSAENQKMDAVVR
ncbi:MAG: NusG domain II-containing protein [Lachnospiraceae bacterium]|nr:NusG domain II-containing protein [Lachnospiraceae bacterium]